MIKEWMSLTFARRAGTLANMTVKTFRELLAHRPFQPFRLVMSSGAMYDVRHPEMAWLTHTDMLVGLDQTDEGVPSEFRICSLLHVATIEPLSPTAAGSALPGPA
ncbi:MAG TPA: hypothetical protein VMV69_27210 [Pirellulales bacterium]|nr:hypothetical protein [Pirellulales bacterium]